jgi:OOP family OmpA-OmpF porin
MKKNLVIFVVAAVSMVGCTKIIRNPESENIETPQEISQTHEMPSQDTAAAAAASASAAEQAKASEVANKAQQVASQVSDQLRFGTASTELKPEAVQGLKQLGGMVAQNPSATVKIDGYTDNTGSKEYNDKLSIERAQAVKSTLAASGVPADRISVVGHAASDPVASNSTATGRAQNRRAEVEIVTG